MMKIFFIIAYLSLSLWSFQIVDLNTADEEQMMILPGVGKTLAKNIIKYREKNGGFIQKNELLSMSGMTQKKFDKIKDFVVIAALNKKSKKAKKEMQIAAEEPIIDLHVLEKKVIKHLDLERTDDQNMMKRARMAAWLPKFSVGLDLNRRDGSAFRNKKLEEENSLRMNETIRYGAGVKASFDFAGLIFNPSEIDVAKLVLRREEERTNVINKIHKDYFKFKQLKRSLSEATDVLLKKQLEEEIEEIRANLDYLSKNAFSQFYIDNGIAK